MIRRIALILSLFGCNRLGVEGTSSFRRTTNLSKDIPKSREKPSLTKSIKSWLPFQKPEPIVEQKPLTFMEKVADCTKNPNAKIVEPTRAYIAKCITDTQKRRQYYIDNPSTANDLVMNINRAALLVVLAVGFVEIAFESGYLRNGNPFPNLIHNFQHIKEYLIQEYRLRRQKGGIFRIETWKDPALLQRAVQDQLAPKYRFALGSAIGMILSPLTWSVGASGTLWVFGTFAVAELHCFVKAKWKRYGDFMDTTDIPVLWQFDEYMEMLRGKVLDANEDPQSLLSAVRDRIDPSFEFEGFPAEIQRGLLLGFLVGTMLGI